MDILSTLWETFFDVDAMRAALPELLTRRAAQHPASWPSPRR